MKTMDMKLFISSDREHYSLVSYLKDNIQIILIWLYRKQQQYKQTACQQSTLTFKAHFCNTSWILSVEIGDQKQGLAIFLATKFPGHA